MLPVWNVVKNVCPNVTLRLAVVRPLVERKSALHCFLYASGHQIDLIIWLVLNFIPSFYTKCLKFSSVVIKINGNAFESLICS
jgi:hypothetical protein